MTTSHDNLKFTNDGGETAHAMCVHCDQGFVGFSRAEIRRKNVQHKCDSK